MAANALDSWTFDCALEGFTDPPAVVTAKVDNAAVAEEDIRSLMAGGLNYTDTSTAGETAFSTTREDATATTTSYGGAAGVSDNYYVNENGGAALGEEEEDIMTFAQAEKEMYGIGNMETFMDGWQSEGELTMTDGATSVPPFAAQRARISDAAESAPKATQGMRIEDATAVPAAVSAPTAAGGANIIFPFPYVAESSSQQYEEESYDSNYHLLMPNVASFPVIADKTNTAIAAADAKVPEIVGVIGEEGGGRRGRAGTLELRAAVTPPPPSSSVVATGWQVPPPSTLLLRLHGRRSSRGSKVVGSNVNNSKRARGAATVTTSQSPPVLKKMKISSKRRSGVVFSATSLKEEGGGSSDVLLKAVSIRQRPTSWKPRKQMSQQRSSGEEVPLEKRKLIVPPVPPMRAAAMLSASVVQQTAAAASSFSFVNPALSTTTTGGFFSFKQPELLGGLQQQHARCFSSNPSHKQLTASCLSREECRGTGTVTMTLPEGEDGRKVQHSKLELRQARFQTTADSGGAPVVGCLSTTTSAESEPPVIRRVENNITLPNSKRMHVLFEEDAETTTMAAAPPPEIDTLPVRRSTGSRHLLSGSIVGDDTPRLVEGGTVVRQRDSTSLTPILKHLELTTSPIMQQSMSPHNNVATTTTSRTPAHDSNDGGGGRIAGIITSPIVVMPPSTPIRSVVGIPKTPMTREEAEEEEEEEKERERLLMELYVNSQCALKKLKERKDRQHAVVCMSRQQALSFFRLFQVAVGAGTMAQAVKHWTNEPSISNARILSATKNAAKHVKSLLLATTSDGRDKIMEWDSASFGTVIEALNQAIYHLVRFETPFGVVEEKEDDNYTTCGSGDDVLKAWITWAKDRPETKRPLCGKEWSPVDFALIPPTDEDEIVAAVLEECAMQDDRDGKEEPQLYCGHVYYIVSAPLLLLLSVFISRAAKEASTLSVPLSRETRTQLWKKTYASFVKNNVEGKEMTEALSNIFGVLFP